MDSNVHSMQSCKSWGLDSTYACRSGEVMSPSAAESAAAATEIDEFVGLGNGEAQSSRMLMLLYYMLEIEALQMSGG